MPQNKYNAKKVRVDGFIFDSKSEAARYTELKFYLRAGLISDLQIHPTYPLIVNGAKIGSFKPDFRYLNENGTLTIEDIKSKATMTQVSSLRIRVFEAIYGLRVTIIGKSVPKVRRFKSKVAA